METLNNLGALLNANVEKSQTVNVYLKLRDMNLVLVDAPFETSDFSGGIKDLAIIINRITKPFKEAPKNRCYLSVTFADNKVVDFLFEAGKFNVNLNTIINSFVQSSLIANNTNKVLAKERKEQILNTLNGKIQGFIKTLHLLDYIETTPMYKITEELINYNSTKNIENE